MKKNLVLIQPVASYSNPTPVLPQDAVGIGMLTILAYVQKYGYTGQVIHLPTAFNQNYTIKDIEDKIEECDPDVIGIGLNWLHFSEGALDTAKWLRKKYPHKIIVIGGQHATLFAKEIIEKAPFLTAVTVGESEITYVNLIKAALENSTLNNIDGLCLKHNDEIILNPPSIIQNLDDVPFYSYTWVWPKQSTICAALDTVRGTCPKNCSYCIESRTNTLQGRKKFSAHSPKYLANQIKVFYDEGIHSITIQDPITLMGEKYLIEFLNEIIALNIELDLLNIFVEPRTFSREFFELLSKSAKDVVLDYGVESGSSRVLEISGRQFDKEKLLENFKLASDAGIRILTWWMIGMPGETRESVKESFDFMSLSLDKGAIPRWITPLILFPQTDMANKSEDYDINCIYESFDDYMNFSSEHANRYGVYKNLLTHTPKAMTQKAIVENTIAIKKGIVKLLDEKRDFLVSLGWNKMVVQSLIDEVGGSFF